MRGPAGNLPNRHIPFTLEFMILKADCILAGSDFAERSPGLVRVQDDRIAELGSDISTAGDRAIDFCPVAGPGRRTVIIPGLIDGHCHLELSNLGGKIRYKGSLVRWLGELVLKRPKRWAAQANAVHRGVGISLAHGTTTVADISANGRSWQAMMDRPIRKVCFVEVIGIGRKRNVSREQIVEKIDAMPGETATFLKGISPHAPYSTAPEVYRKSIDLAVERGLRLTTHLAEDPAELEFLNSATGPWRKVLKSFGLWDQSIKPAGISPVRFARQIGLLDVPAILAHVNYVNNDDIDILSHGHASVVYCPLAHRYFGHQPHGYRRMIDAGINVALGNDSLACCGDLSILAQMREVFHAGGLSPQSVFAMATTAGAKALHLQETIGTIEPGKAADLVVMSVDKNDDPVIESIVKGRGKVLAVMVAGKLLRSPDAKNC